MAHPEFRMECDPIEVTMLHRPDTGWKFIDAAGHEHRWYVGDEPADRYDPMTRYGTPTLTWVKDGEEYWEGDDEPHPVGHLECRICGEHVQPQYKADECRQYIPGLKRCYIDDQPVSYDEFTRRAQEFCPDIKF